MMMMTMIGMMMIIMIGMMVSVVVSVSGLTMATDSDWLRREDFVTDTVDMDSALVPESALPPISSTALGRLCKFICTMHVPYKV